MVLFAQQLYSEDEGAGTSYLLQVPREVVDWLDEGAAPSETRSEVIGRILDDYDCLGLELEPDEPRGPEFLSTVRAWISCERAARFDDVLPDEGRNVLLSRIIRQYHRLGLPVPK